MTDEAKTTVPQGRPADQRIIGAIQSLCDQFGVCGLKAPLAILVAPGERRRLEHLVAGSGLLLIEDARATGTTSIWGVAIKEPGE